MEITLGSVVLGAFVLLVLLNLFQFIERAVEALEKQAGIASPPNRFTRRLAPFGQQHQCNHGHGHNHPPAYQQQQQQQQQ